MTIKLIEGFDAFGNVENLLRRWRSSTPAQIAITGGRIAYGLNVQNGGECTRNMFQDETAIVLGFAYYKGGGDSGGGDGDDTADLISIMSSTFDVDDDPQWTDVPIVTLSYDTAGLLVLHDGDSTGTVLGTSTTAIVPSTFFYIEIKATISGSVIVRIDETVEITATLPTATVMNSVRFMGPTGDKKPLVYFDDLYILSQDGTYNNDYLGDVKVRTLFPFRTGRLAEWYPQPYSGDPSVQYSRINQIPADDDFTWIGMNDSGGVDGYVSNFEFVDIPTADVVHAVETVALARVTSPTSDYQFHPSLRVRENFDESSTITPQPTLTALFTYQGGLFEVDANDGVRITTAHVNGRDTSIPHTDKTYLPGVKSGAPWTHITAEVHVTQLTTQILVTGIGSTEEIRVTQYPLEALMDIASIERFTRVTQEVIEVAVTPDSSIVPAIVTQEVVEIAVKPATSVVASRVTQEVVEVLIWLGGDDFSPTPRPPKNQVHMAG